MPDSSRSKRIALHITVSSDSSTVADDPLLFIGLVSLMVSTQRDTYNLVLPTASWNLLLASQRSPGVSDIGAEDFVPNDQNTDTSGP